MILEKRGELTFLEAAKIILMNNNNIPMSANEIWDEIVSNGLNKKISYKDTRPGDSLYYMLLKSSVNSGIKSQYKTKNFEIIGDNPKKFKIVDRIIKFDEFEDNSEIESDKQEEPEITEYIENPFKQAICVLGESGAGKSHTIETILENEGHEFEFIIPTAATTGLLAQFSPTKSGYVPSRLDKMIIDAAQNPDTLYTAVFDECHKSSTIEMINDELLQCISIHRNNGVRFISLDHDTAELYNVDGLEKRRGNIILPDNFGFIFISSKPRVISNNADFFNRVDIVILRHFEEETIESSDELLEKVLDSDEKKKLVSTRND